MPGTTRCVVRAAWIVTLLWGVACASSAPPRVEQAGEASVTVSHAGFDVSHYPGDAAMRAWLAPASPYKWVGYYLAAPCRRDSSWVGKRGSLVAMGWGTAPIYVGQQDWTQHARATGAAATAAAASTADSGTSTASAPRGTGACSSRFLTAAQGASEASDAAAKMHAEGFPAGSTIYLDVELVSTVTPALRDYVGAWVDGVLRDGRYRAGLYSAKSNAETLYDLAFARYRAAGRSDRPPFWVSSTAGFASTRAPSDVGLSFAQIWQGQVSVAQTFNGVPLEVDVNVAALPDPGAP